MEPMILVLLPSPLLGPAVWGPVAAGLASRGYEVHMAAAPPTAPRVPNDVLDHFLSAVPADRDVILVPHSNAGLYVPALAEQRHVVGAVFVDAALPSGDGDIPLAPPELLTMLAAKAEADGVLPPWTAWWDESDVASLFPTPAVRAQIERQQLRLPLTYFAAELPVAPGWDTELAGAYLAFGDTYADERALAAARGWPTATLPGSHLHMLVDPATVTQEVRALLEAIGFPGHP